MKAFTLLSIFLFYGISSFVNSEVCNLSSVILGEIKGYQNFVNEITKEVTNGNYSGRLYEDLTNFVDQFGNRMTGSDNLENSIAYLGERMENELNGKGKVIYDPVEVPVWTRGVEEAEVITPMNKSRKLHIKALGSSPSADLEAPLIVVRDFEELVNKSSEAKGKIVLFNAEFTKYEDTVFYRREGPANASKYGAVAALVRSITPFSIGSVHVGSTEFGPDDNPIAAAAITLEDADYLDRIYRAKNNFTIKLLITSKLEGKRNSSNLILDLPGSLEPQQYTVLSGHIDSWDVGQGALDDGYGAFIALHSLLLLKHLNITPPRRTFRSILWTAEEEGLIGAKAHLAAHEDEVKNWTSAYETDLGAYPVLGLNVASNQNETCLLQAVLSLFQNFNTTALREVDSAGSDISIFKDVGVPLLEPYMTENNYFWFHHTDGDSMRTLNSTVLDQHLAFATATTYILANISTPLRNFN